MKNIIAATLIALGLVGGSALMPAANAAPAKHEVSARPWWMKTPCKSEDSVNCFWNAGTAGNHRGHSFIVREMPGSKHMVCVMYIKRADAKRWDYCS